MPQPGVPVASSVQLPNHSGFLGLRLAWQSVTFDANGSAASNPTHTLVR